MTRMTPERWKEILHLIDCEGGDTRLTHLRLGHVEDMRDEIERLQRELATHEWRGQEVVNLQEENQRLTKEVELVREANLAKAHQWENKALAAMKELAERDKQSELLKVQLSEQSTKLAASEAGAAAKHEALSEIADKGKWEFHGWWSKQMHVVELAQQALSSEAGKAFLEERERDKSEIAKWYDHLDLCAREGDKDKAEIARLKHELEVSLAAGRLAKLGFNNIEKERDTLKADLEEAVQIIAEAKGTHYEGCAVGGGCPFIEKSKAFLARHRSNKERGK